MLFRSPYYRVIEKNVAANVQAGRGGAATVYFNVLDPEIEDLLVLRNPTTIAEKKIKDIDYGLSYNATFLRKVAQGEQWMLISYLYAEDLWKAMYSNDISEFERLYEFYDTNPNVKKKYVSARTIAITFLTQSYEVGRNYEFAADHVNYHTPFKDAVYSSNLCAEIALPTKPFTSILDLYSKDAPDNLYITTDQGKQIVIKPNDIVYLANGDTILGKDLTTDMELCDKVYG